MLSDYELTARLSGDDAFELRRGRRTQTAAPVLLKLSRAEAPRAADAAALRRECALAAELSSASTLLPRLVESHQRTAMVMEDPGGDLLSSARHAPRLPFDVVASIGTQLAETLSELHARGVVHAGLRPAAVLCDTDTPRAWLIDFADVRGQSPSDMPAGCSAERLIYTAPEQTGRIDRTVDHRADLYALGVLLYELLCGAPPFESDDALELIHRHLAAEPIAPSERDPKVPAALSAVVMRLLAKSPDERYQTANGVAHDLKRCADDWSRYARIHPFTLGERDASGQLSLATKLYGRDARGRTAARRIRTGLCGMERAGRDGAGRGVCRHRQDGADPAARAAHRAPTRLLHLGQVRPGRSRCPVRRADAGLSWPGPAAPDRARGAIDGMAQCANAGPRQQRRCAGRGDAGDPVHRRAAGCAAAAGRHRGAEPLPARAAELPVGAGAARSPAGAVPRRSAVGRRCDARSTRAAAGQCAASLPAAARCVPSGGGAGLPASAGGADVTAVRRRAAVAHRARPPATPGPQRRWWPICCVARRPTPSRWRR